jgi:iron complex outermembrane receptor protein
MSSNWQFQAQASLIRSRDLSRNAPLIYQQADRCSLNLRWQKELSAGGKWQLCAEAGPQLVARQTRAPETDFVPPPPGYVLWNARLSLSNTTGKFPLEASIEGQNLLNNAYRDYMNRFRYFAYDTGRNIVFRFALSI